MKPKSLIKSSQKFIVSDLCVFTIKQSPTALNLITKLITGLPKTVYVTFIRSVKHFTLITSFDFYSLISKKLSKYIEGYRCNLEAVVFNFPKEAYTTPGVLSKLLDHFKSKGINVFESFTSYLDVTLLIDKIDNEKLKKIIS